jgi:hypothetical protein
MANKITSTRTQVEQQKAPAQWTSFYAAIKKILEDE